MTPNEWPVFPKPPELCPRCGKLLTKTSSATGVAPPVPGDFTVCIGCSHILEFDQGGRLKIPTHETLDALPLAFKNDLLKARLAVWLAIQGFGGNVAEDDPREKPKDTRP